MYYGFWFVFFCDSCVCKCVFASHVYLVVFLYLFFFWFDCFFLFRFIFCFTLFYDYSLEACRFSFFFVFILLSYILIMASSPSTPPISPYLFPSLPDPWLLFFLSEKSRPSIERSKGCGPGRQRRWGGTERSRGVWNHSLNILNKRNL